MIGYNIISRSNSKASSTTTGPATVIRTDALEPRDLTAEGDVHRTLDDIRIQVAQELSVRCITKAETVDDIRIGVYISSATEDEQEFIALIAMSISQQLRLSSHLFILGCCVTSVSPQPSSLIVLGSSDDLVQRAILLVSSKFIGRILSPSRDSLKRWSAQIHDLGGSAYDSKALWDVVRKAARKSIDPLLPPPGSRGIDQMLSDARARLQRLSPREAYRELQDNQVSAPTFLVDIRPVEQRRKHGGIHGSIVIERNVLEWRLDPRCDARLAIADRYDLRVIVFCQEGYTSSLAAFALQQLGLLNATDIIGGIEAWKLAGLPVDMDAERPEPRSLASLAGSFV